MRKLMIVAILVVVALTALNLFYEDGIKPDAVYPMANRNIHWFYAGK